MKIQLYIIIILILANIICISCEHIDKPSSLYRCWIALNKIIDKSEIQIIKNGIEDNMDNYHFSIGLFIRNNWVRDGNPELLNYFEKLGISQPDDISSIVLKTYWQYLNKKPLELEKEIRYIKEYREFMHKNANFDDLFIEENSK